MGTSERTVDRPREESICPSKRDEGGQGLFSRAVWMGREGPNQVKRWLPAYVIRIAKRRS